VQVVAEYKLQQEKGVLVKVGKLSLIDLAGSERALATDQRTCGLLKALASIGLYLH
jgi:kinesin family protein 18/19